MYARCHSNTDNTNFQMWLNAHNWASLSLHFATCLDLSVPHFTCVMASHFNCTLFFWISFLCLIYTFILQLCVVWTVFYRLSSFKLSGYSIMHNLYTPLTWDYSCHFPWLSLYGINLLDLSWGILMSGNQQTAQETVFGVSSLID